MILEVAAIRAIVISGIVIIIAPSSRFYFNTIITSDGRYFSSPEWVLATVYELA
jgi:hypothetical protein